MARHLGLGWGLGLKVWGLGFRVLGLKVGIMEKKMETTTMGLYGVLGFGV